MWKKVTKIDFIARHKRIQVEKSVILKQPTCPTDKLEDIYLLSACSTTFLGFIL